MPTKPSLINIGDKILAQDLNDLVGYFNEYWAGSSYQFDTNHDTNLDDRRFGWGQVDSTSQVSASTVIEAEHANQVAVEINTALWHINEDINLLFAPLATPLPNFKNAGDTIVGTYLNDLSYAIEQLIDSNKFLADQMDTNLNLSQQSTYTSSWADDLTVTHKFTWTDNVNNTGYNQARHFFNSGGELGFELQMQSGGTVGSQVWQKLFNDFDSFRLGAESLKIVADVDDETALNTLGIKPDLGDTYYDLLGNNSVPAKGFYQGIDPTGAWRTIADVAAFRYGDSQDHAYVYIHSAYNSRRIRLEMKAEENVGVNFSVFVKITLIEDIDDDFLITQPITLTSSWYVPETTPDLSDPSTIANLQYFYTNNPPPYMFVQPNVPSIREESAWTPTDVATPTQLEDWDYRDSSDPGNNWTKNTGNSFTKN